MDIPYKKVKILNMVLDKWSHKSCTAHFASTDNWATLYNIESKIKKKGHATELLTRAKNYYESLNLLFASSISLNSGMRRILIKLKIKEYI